MSSPRTRVLEEIVLLDEKISKLNDFIADTTSAYQFLSDGNRELLRDQLIIMSRYAEILNMRIEYWED